MPGICRVGLDSHIGHASPTPNPFHQTSYASGAATVRVNGAAAVRIGDATGCGDPATGGSSTVKIEGAYVHRQGDSTGGHGSWPGNAAASGSGDVRAG